MKNASLILLLAMLMIACNNKKESTQPVSRLDSITNSVLEQYPDLPEEAIERKVLEQLLAGSPGAFQKIEEGERLIGEFSKYIDTLVVAFAMYCGAESPGVIKASAANDSTLTNEFFIEHGNGKSLHGRLWSVTRALKDIVATDSSRDRLDLIVKLPPSIEGKPHYEDFAHAYFHHLTPIKAQALLTHFEKQLADMRSIIFKEYTNAVSSQP